MSIGGIRPIIPSSTNVSQTVTIYGEPFNMDDGADLGIYCKGNNGTASYTPIFQVSYNDTLSNFITPNGYPSITTIAGSATQMFNVTQYNMFYGRIGFTATAGVTSITSSYIFNREIY